MIRQCVAMKFLKTLISSKLNFLKQANTIGLVGHQFIASRKKPLYEGEPQEDTLRRL